MRGDAPLVQVFGRRGAGKSTRVKELIRDTRRLVVFDPMGEYARARGFTRCDSVRQVRDQLARRWRRGFRLALVPARSFERCLDSLAALIWLAQAPYEDGRAPQVTMVVEEMNLGYPNRSNRPEHFTRLVLQGRHRGVGMVGVSQRPALVHPDYRGNAIETYLFALADHRDIDAVRGLVGRAREAELRALQVHEYLYVCGGQVLKGRNSLKNKR